MHGTKHPDLKKPERMGVREAIAQVGVTVSDAAKVQWRAEAVYKLTGAAGGCSCNLCCPGGAH